MDKVTILRKYAQLIVHYSLYLKKGEKVFINTTTLAEPLLKYLHEEITKVGAHANYFIAFEGQETSFLENASNDQLAYTDPFKLKAMQEYDAYLGIAAPYNLFETDHISNNKLKIYKAAGHPINKVYNDRLGVNFKRTSCLYPNQAHADLAEMSLEEYEQFVFNAMHLFDENPEAEWNKLSVFQQRIVDILNTKKHFQYKSPDIDIQFSTEGRIWENSDGKNNMPSGEVFTSPIEESVNGHIRFSYPAYYQGKTVEDVQLVVKNGKVVGYSAKSGQDYLDEIFAIDGARYFGEVAIATNKQIQRHTKNILFDEKIGGTIHMAIGQSYYKCGGKNTSTVHWDMIANMKKGGEIIADGEVIYRNGEFII